MHPSPQEEILTVGDSRYSKPTFVYPLVVEEASNVLVLLRHNRVVYTSPLVWGAFCPP